MNTKISFRNLVRCALLGLAAVTVTTSSQAAFHLWSIRELYSDNTGNLQFIELVDFSGGQEFVGGQQIMVTSGTTHTYTIPGNLPFVPGSTFNHAFLIGTAGLQAAGGPLPDFIMPNGFLFLGGATITFFGANSGSYTALPTDGNLSRIYPTAGNQVNSPQNFAGTVGHVPEPTTLALLALSGIGLGISRRRRSA